MIYQLAVERNNACNALIVPTSGSDRSGVDNNTALPDFFQFIRPHCCDRRRCFIAGFIEDIPGFLWVTDKKQNLFRRKKSIKCLDCRQSCSASTENTDCCTCYAFFIAEERRCKTCNIRVMSRKFAMLIDNGVDCLYSCLLYTSPSPRDRQKSRMPSSA